MKLEIKDSANYAAQVVRVPEPFDLPNADRLVGVGIFGYTVITQRDGNINEGDLAVFFPAESQLSEGIASYANLFRHSELNQDPNEKGYLEDNRRVRALKLRGTISSGLLLPVEVVENFLGGKLSEGDVFDHIDGVEICRKYRIKEPVVVDRTVKKIAKAFKRVDETLLPEHLDTDQWLRNEHLVHENQNIIVTQKLHGTSVRLARTVVRRKLKWYERVLKRLGLAIAETEYDAVAGSRKVIKDPNNPNQKHFYGEAAGDVWTDKLRDVENVIPKGYVIYGEIVGFTKDGKPIQKGHTYEAEPGTNDLYVYRVATVNPDGVISDLSWDQVRGFCDSRGLKYVPELWRGAKKDFILEAFEEKNFSDEYRSVTYPDAPVRLSTGGTGKDEGIAIRVEGTQQVPALFKVKNASHYEFETKVLDAGEEDLEAQES